MNPKQPPFPCLSGLLMSRKPVRTSKTHPWDGSVCSSVADSNPKNMSNTLKKERICVMKNNAKRMAAKMLAMLIAIMLIVGLFPVMAFADGTANASNSDGEYVYLSISYDKHYINDKNGSPMVYVPVSLEDIAAVDLTEYGLDNMLYDADADGEYEITALQLLIYAHEELWGGDWGDVNFDALPGSSYFKGGIFGFTENLVYFLNGDFPVDESMSNEWMTTGATSDRIVYRVNGWYPNYGCSRYQLADGEVVEWRYTCNDLGKDIGCDWMG